MKSADLISFLVRKLGSTPTFRVVESSMADVASVNPALAAPVCPGSARPAEVPVSKDDPWSVLWLGPCAKIHERSFLQLFTPAQTALDDFRLRPPRTGIWKAPWKVL